MKWLRSGVEIISGVQERGSAVVERIAVRENKRLERNYTGKRIMWNLDPALAFRNSVKWEWPRGDCEGLNCYRHNNYYYGAS
jgi:hypothetical protein